MLDSRVFSFCVLADKNSVNIVVWGLETLDGNARADVREEIEGPSECKIQRDVSLADYSFCECTTRIEDSQLRTGSGKRSFASRVRWKTHLTSLLRTFECNCILLNRSDGVVGDDSLATLEDGSNADFLPLNWDLARHEFHKLGHTRHLSTYLRRSVNIFHRLANLGTDSCTSRVSIPFNPHGDAMTHHHRG